MNKKQVLPIDFLCLHSHVITLKVPDLRVGETKNTVDIIPDTSKQDGFQRWLVIQGGVKYVLL